MKNVRAFHCALILTLIVLPLAIQVATVSALAAYCTDHGILVAVFDTATKKADNNGDGLVCAHINLKTGSTTYTDDHIPKA